MLSREATSIVLLTPSAKAGGAERAFASLASTLSRAGVRPSVALLEPGPLEQWLRNAGCSYTVAPAGTAGSLEAAADWVARESARVGAAAIVSNKTQGHLVGGRAAQAADLPAVWWQQDIACGIDYELAAAALPVAVVVCSSDYALSAQRELTPTANLRKVHLGVPVTEVAGRRGSGSAVRRELSSNGRPLVGIVARLEIWKGQDVFLRAAARIRDLHPDAIFLVVGGAELEKEPDYPAELQQLARTLGIEDCVRFVGHAGDVFPWLDALDVCVHATHGEPFGLVLVEAMALGTPLVATALGGPVEIVEDGLSGLLVPPGDEDALARAACTILADRGLSRRLADGGSRRARSFTDERMASEFAEVIRTVASA